MESDELNLLYILFSIYYCYLVINLPISINLPPKQSTSKYI